MRVVVITTKNGRAAVAGENGCMCYIKDDGYQRGQILEIEDSLIAKRAVEGSGRIISFKGSSLREFTPKVSGIVAALCAVAVTGGMLAYAAPVRSISDESEPEIEYSVNLFERVIGVTAGTSETEIETGVIYHEVSGKTIDEAMEITRKLIGNKQKEEDTVDAPGSGDYPAKEAPQGEKTEPAEDRKPIYEETHGDNTEITAPGEPEKEAPVEENNQSEEKPEDNDAAPEKPSDNSGFDEQKQPEQDSDAQPDMKDGKENVPPPPENDGHKEPPQGQDNDYTGERPPNGGPPPGDVHFEDAPLGDAQPSDSPPEDAPPPGNAPPY